MNQIFLIDRRTDKVGQGRLHKDRNPELRQRKGCKEYQVQRHGDGEMTLEVEADGCGGALPAWRGRAES